MVLAQERAEHEQAIELAELRHLHAEPGRALAERVRRKVGVTQPEVDVVTAQGAREAREQMQFLERRVRAAEKAERGATLTLGDVAEPLCHVFDRGLPVRLTEGAVLADHRLREPIRDVERFIREAVLVGEPALVQRFVLQRQYTHHTVLLHLDHEIRAESVVRAYRSPP